MHEKTKIVLFLQGPNSTFFSRLADRLEDLGHHALRINLCFSDWLFWRRRGARNYRGNLTEWPEYLRDFLVEHGVTDIVLLGEQRPHHRAPVELAAKHDIHVTVTEWGYLRPDWITFEKDGMSGNTRFPKDRTEIMALARGVPHPDLSLKYPDSFLRLASNGLAGDVGNWVFAFIYPGYRPHLHTNPVFLYATTATRIAKSKLRHGNTERTVRRLIDEAEQQPFFVFPMQIEADYQLRAYSRFSGMEEALSLVVTSFAKCAPTPTRLLVKAHPLDPGVKPWKKIIGNMASRHAIHDRVFFIDGGEFGELATASAGVVTVNSTCGVEALRSGKAVKTLGQSVYDIPGLTHQQDIESFWSSPQEPDPTLREAFIRAISSCIQIKGGFFSKSGVHAAVSVAAARLSEGRVNQPIIEHGPGRSIFACEHTPTTVTSPATA
jgi:capsular polysaccharide export protein